MDGSSRLKSKILVMKLLDADACGPIEHKA